LFDTATPTREITEAKMVVTELTELLRDALVDRGFLGLAEAECVYVRKDSTVRKTTAGVPPMHWEERD
jgi:hypothetical protein